jgi:hypothetical protein
MEWILSQESYSKLRSFAMAAQNWNYVDGIALQPLCGSCAVTTKNLSFVWIYELINIRLEQRRYSVTNVEKSNFVPSFKKYPTNK